MRIYKNFKFILIGVIIFTLIGCESIAQDNLGKIETIENIRYTFETDSSIQNLSQYRDYPYSINTFSYHNHEYIIFHFSDGSTNIVHNPECKCMYKSTSLFD